MRRGSCCRTPRSRSGGLNPEPPAPLDDPPLPGPREPLRVLGYPTNGIADEVALTMLAHLLDDLPIAVEITRTRLQASELLSLVREQGFSVVCLADLPPSPPSKTRYLVKRLHATLPDVRILVGRWGPPALADESTQVLRDAGATSRGLDAAGDPDVLGRARGDPADSRSGANRRARRVAARTTLYRSGGYGPVCRSAQLFPAPLAYAALLKSL